MLETKYGHVIKSVNLSESELEIIEKVNQGEESDRAKSPFNDDKWYKGFYKDNIADSITLVDAPKNEVLMVVDHSLHTLYDNNDRGTHVTRGTLLIKLEDDLVYCLNGSTWFISSSNQALTASIKGFFTFSKDINKGVKRLCDVVV